MYKYDHKPHCYHLLQNLNVVMVTMIGVAYSIGSIVFAVLVCVLVATTIPAFDVG